MEYVDLSDLVISVDRVDGHWTVLINGAPVKPFYGTDAMCRAGGYAMALLEGRGLRPS